MGITQDLADKLAEDAIAASEDLDDPGLIDEIAKILGDTSSTTLEAFKTSVRVRLAEARARKHLERRIAKAKGAGPGGEGG
ncbi:MAG: hypothetical protein ACP5DX_09330 [Paracoccaceae bacterium]|jgi:hypothetical protein